MNYKLKLKPIDNALRDWNLMPDAAWVRLPVVKALFGYSAATAWRNSKNGTLPAPRKLSARVTAWNVGEIRVALAKHAAGEVES